MPRAFCRPWPQTFIFPSKSNFSRGILTFSSQPSIYDPPPTEILLLDTPSALEAHIGTVRRATTGKYREAHAHVQGLVSRWIGVENQVEHRVKSLLPPDERLVPGVLYAAVAFLSGAIVARHRILPIRALLPPVLGTAALVHFNPRLSANIRAYAGALEDEHLPAVAQFHETGKAHALMGWERVREGTESARGKVSRGVLEAVEKVQGATGLRIREALGVAREIEQKVERVIEEKVADLEGVADTVEKKAEEAAKERVV
ncbi:apolipo protein O-domain-containing protein [Mycena metata]|uniref:MICOS complex subunit n=1 Tax=Mycena metata TaxID=1033252 RepID=A0AAD7I1P9_9AGAR|nr:apolipo protein O-domain-containing protein [Mycena metata]